MILWKFILRYYIVPLGGNIEFFEFSQYAQAMRRQDLGVLLPLIIACTMSIGTVFLYCFFGSLTTDQFLRYAHISYESEWYTLPIELQKFIQLIIADAQRPRIFQGFKIIDLNLLAFTKVSYWDSVECGLISSNFKTFPKSQIMKTVITYYMMFKRLAKWIAFCRWPLLGFYIVAHIIALFSIHV